MASWPFTKVAQSAAFDVGGRRLRIHPAFSSSCSEEEVSVTCPSPSSLVSLFHESNSSWLHPKWCWEDFVL